MHYHDLTSMEQVEAMPIPEFNLRLVLIHERLGIADVSPTERTQPISKRSLIEVLLEEQDKRRPIGGPETVDSG